MEGEHRQHIMLAVIVVSYRSDERTIGFVRNETPKISLPYIVVIVNNGAVDESNERLAEELNAVIVKSDSAEIPESGVYIIANPDNSGFAKGNNMGFRFAMAHFTPEYILFSNNDIRICSSHCVPLLIDKLNSVPNVGIIGPSVVGLNGEAQSPEPYRSFMEKYVAMYLATPFITSRKKIEFFKLDYSKNAQEGFHYKIMGSFFIVRSTDFFACGMMDENTFLYGEEVILAERLKRLGLGVYYYPQVGVVHDHGATTGRCFKSVQIAQMIFKSECYYYRRYMGVPWWKILMGRTVHFIWLVLKLL